MLNNLFEYLNVVDGWLAPYLSDLVRIGLYGAVSGFLALLIYVLLSNQSKLKKLKGEVKVLRNQMRVATLNYREMMQLSKKNVLVSLRLLGQTLKPCVLSSLPVILFMTWLSNYFSYTLPINGKTINVSIVPNTALVVVEPSKIAKQLGNGKYAVDIEAGERMWFSVDGKTVYEGIITDHPVPTIHKKRWWNSIIGNDAGYIRSNVPVDEIIFDLPRKQLIEGAPAWLSTWEFPFFLLLFVTSITTKVMFSIE